MKLSAERQRVINEADHVIEHAAHWLYEQDRPIPLLKIKSWTGKTDIKTDCSGSVIGISYRAGVPDPSGYNYSGAGNTNSFFSSCEHIDYKTCQPGDIIDVGNSTGTEHAYLVVGRTANGDLKVFSHGGPTLHDQPRYEFISQVKDYWYGRGFVFTGLRYLSTDPPPSWDILNRKGEKIGHTEHPVRWCLKHPRSFRKHATLSFVRRKP